MAFEEKRAWIMLAVTLAAYGTYAALVLARAGAVPLPETPYAGTLVTTVVVAIVAAVALEVAVSVTADKDERRKDQRDREISRFGDHIGQSFVVLGGVAALLLALARLDHFWIANAVYLAFALSAVLGSTAKIVAYRRGFQPW